MSGCREEPTWESKPETGPRPSTHSRACVESVPQPLQMSLSAKQHGGEKGQGTQDASTLPGTGQTLHKITVIATAAHFVLDLKFVL